MWKLTKQFKKVKTGILAFYILLCNNTNCVTTPFCCGITPTLFLL